MDRRKFLGLVGKATAVAVVAPQVLAEVKPVTSRNRRSDRKIARERYRLKDHPELLRRYNNGEMIYSWELNNGTN